jgi:AraC-like DNA-binding protein
MTSPSTDPLDDPVFWRAVVDRLGLNPMHSPYSIRSISAEHGVSPERAYAKFQAHFHTAPWEWMQ